MDAMKVPSFTMMPGMFFFKKISRSLRSYRSPLGIALKRTRDGARQYPETKRPRSVRRLEFVLDTVHQKVQVIQMKSIISEKQSTGSNPLVHGLMLPKASWCFLLGWAIRH
jgi:hypothetical protein